MTAEQAIKWEILNLIDGVNVSYHAESVEDAWELADESDEHWDYMNEVRYNGQQTDLEAPHSRHYEPEQHALKLSNGVWVSFTYWRGGGKHSNPEEVEWMYDAFFVDCKEEEVTKIERTFTKK